MISKLKTLFEKGMTKLISIIKDVLTLFTLFSFAVLFVLFFMFMYKGQSFECLVCLAGIYTFIHLNKVLQRGGVLYVRKDRVRYACRRYC